MHDKYDMTVHFLYTKKIEVIQVLFNKNLNMIAQSWNFIRIKLVTCRHNMSYMLDFAKKKSIQPTAQRASVISE